MWVGLKIVCFYKKIINCFSKQSILRILDIQSQFTYIVHWDIRLNLTWGQNSTSFRHPCAFLVPFTGVGTIISSRDLNIQISEFLPFTSISHMAYLPIRIQAVKQNQWNIPTYLLKSCNCLEILLFVLFFHKWIIHGM